jgi:hypothetical protein
MSRDRPIGVTVLTILAGAAAFLSIFFSLQFLGLALFNSAVDFFGSAGLGAAMWAIMALIWLWLMRMLWNVNPQAWLFLVVITIFNLILAVVSIIGGTDWELLLPSLILNGLVLIYCVLPGTREAFQTA